MATKAKHAFGSSADVQSALQSGTIDAYDILFLDGNTDKPKIGWVTKDGKAVIVKDEKADLTELEDSVSELEEKLSTKADAEEVNSKVSALEEEVATKVSAEALEAEVSELEAEVATKANAEEVDAKINTAVSDAVSEAQAYADEKVQTTLVEYLFKDYEITNAPEGTLVDYRDKEIRVMCPSNTKWVIQQSGEGSEPNKFYIGFKAYAPNKNVVSFKEDLSETINDSTMYYFEGNDFAGIDGSGKKYSIVWLPVAVYENGAWTYYGASSSVDKYIGWYYSVEWYDANGVVIASDCIRINLSNEDCHSSITPSYAKDVINIANNYTDEQIAKISSSIEVVEF